MVYAHVSTQVCWARSAGNSTIKMHVLLLLLLFLSRFQIAELFCQCKIKCIVPPSPLPTDTAKVPVNYVGKLLEGFTVSAKPLPQKKVFPPPPLPKGFRPFHKFKKTAEQLAQEAVGEKPAATGQPPSRQKLNAVERGMMLDESPIASECLGVGCELLQVVITCWVLLQRRKVWGEGVHKWLVMLCFFSVWISTELTGACFCCWYMWIGKGELRNADF